MPIFTHAVLENYEPWRVTALLQHLWAIRYHDDNIPDTEVGHPDRRSDLKPLSTVGGTAHDRRFRWNHLIYAYMIENTRVWEIMRRVVFEYLHGEKLGTPLREAQPWLQATEQFLYNDPLPIGPLSVVSHIRPFEPTTRASLYSRVFDMQLNHGGDDGKPFPVVKADASNVTFVATFEELLREVWVAMSYIKASSSADLTDPSKIFTLIQKLHDMLRSRRQNGNLGPEEFRFVAQADWLRETLSYDSPIVRSMRADATGIEQRLFKIAERVGLPAHGLSRSFFEIAEPISTLLIAIEANKFTSVASVAVLYNPNPAPNIFEEAMRTILTHWATIRGIKAWK